MFKKIFTNDKFFGAVTFLGVIAPIAYAIIGIVSFPESMDVLIINIFIALGLLSIYVSYKKYNKNVMKGMIGSVLMALLIRRLLFLNMIYIPIDRACTILLFVLTLCLFLNHYAINSTHMASSWRVYTNQLLCVLMAVIDLVWNVFSVIYAENTSAAIISSLCAIAWPCISAAIVCIESRLDAYRLDREAAGWTEEAGYPEGYVHQKDR